MVDQLKNSIIQIEFNQKNVVAQPQSTVVCVSLVPPLHHCCYCSIVSVTVQGF